MSLRRLNLRIQGLPESYATEPFMGDTASNVEPMPPIAMHVPHHLGMPSSHHPHGGLSPGTHGTHSPLPSHHLPSTTHPNSQHEHSPLLSHELHNQHHQVYSHSPIPHLLPPSSELVSPYESGSREVDDHRSTSSGSDVQTRDVGTTTALTHKLPLSSSPTLPNDSVPMLSSPNTTSPTSVDRSLKSVTSDDFKSETPVELIHSRDVGVGDDSVMDLGLIMHPTSIDKVEHTQLASHLPSEQESDVSGSIHTTLHTTDHSIKAGS
jgi:hypothetical protein